MVFLNLCSRCMLSVDATVGRCSETSRFTNSVRSAVYANIFKISQTQDSLQIASLGYSPHNTSLTSILALSFRRPSIFSKQRHLRQHQLLPFHPSPPDNMDIFTQKRSSPTQPHVTISAIKSDENEAPPAKRVKSEEYIVTSTDRHGYSVDISPTKSQQNQKQVNGMDKLISKLMSDNNDAYTNDGNVINGFELRGQDRKLEHDSDPRSNRDERDSAIGEAHDDSAVRAAELDGFDNNNHNGSPERTTGGSSPSISNASSVFLNNRTSNGTTTSIVDYGVQEMPPAEYEAEESIDQEGYVLDGIEQDDDLDSDQDFDSSSSSPHEIQAADYESEQEYTHEYDYDEEEAFEHNQPSLGICGICTGDMYRVTVS